MHHYGSIETHVDGKVPGEAPDGHCNINYIISSTDDSAYTEVMNDVVKEQYQSVPGTCWLIDTNTAHRVVNNGYREVFQIKIYNSCVCEQHSNCDD